MLESIKECRGFDWDQGNIDKNWLKHKIANLEAEEVFFNEPLIISNDNKHSEKEIRYFALGQTNQKRLLFTSFTIRNNKIRIISVRDQNKSERRQYEKNI